MDHEQPQWNLREGMNVLGADGGKIGQVVGVQATFFVVEKGWLFPADYYIPADAIERVDADTVHLTVSKQEALHKGWDVLPVDEAEALHRDAAAAGTTLGGYTAEMGKMETAVDVSPTDVATALEHPTPTPTAPEASPSAAEVVSGPNPEEAAADVAQAEPVAAAASVEAETTADATETALPIPPRESGEATEEAAAESSIGQVGPRDSEAEPAANDAAQAEVSERASTEDKTESDQTDESSDGSESSAPTAPRD